jgi:hypothetical protein
MTYQQQSKTVVYRSKMNPGPQEKLRHLSRLGLDCDSYHAYPQQDKGEQLIRYYGYYSNVSRRKRKKEKPEEKTRQRDQP